MKKCPRHPGMDTMVPCMNCGRYFCVRCTPRGRGANYYCNDCSREVVENLQSKMNTPDSHFAELIKGVVGRARRTIRLERGRPTVKGAGRQQRVKSIPGEVKRDRITAATREPVSEWWRAVRAVPSNLRARVEKHNERREAERLGRSERLLAVARRRREEVEELPEFFHRAIDRTADAVRSAGRAVLDGVVWLLLFLPRLIVKAARYCWENFPLGLTDNDMRVEFLDLRGRLRLFVALTAGGVLVWVFSVYLVRGRWAASGILIAVAVSVLLIRSDSWHFSNQAGMAAAAITVTAIVIGEQIVVWLYRMRVLVNIGISRKAIVLTGSLLDFFIDFFWWFVVGILALSALVAFFIAAWPFPKRLYHRARRE